MGVKSKELSQKCQYKRFWNKLIATYCQDEMTFPQEFKRKSNIRLLILFVVDSLLLTLALVSDE